MNVNNIIRLFENGNVCVTGLRGCGKDMLMANVIARRGGVYVSNIDYKCRRKGFKKSTWLKLNLPKFDLKNTYDNFVSGEIVPYDYPYPEHSDIYVSDCGVYFPAQYCNELNKKYQSFPYFQALSRHLGDCNFHFNAQNLNRVWDKIREQSDTYLRCNWCRVLPFGWVFQKVTVYDTYDACLRRVKPFKPLRPPLLSRKEARALYITQNVALKRHFDEVNGSVKSYLLIYRNKSKYDTRFFKSLLKGVQGEEV